MNGLTAKKVKRLRRKIMRYGYYSKRRKEMHQHLEYWRLFRYIDCDYNLVLDCDEAMENQQKYNHEFPRALRRYNYYLRKEKERIYGNY